MGGKPPEALFYHLERQPLEQVLPGLIERTLERGWRAVIQAGSKERVEALDTLLWTFSEESFLPHGTKSDGLPAEQPVYLTVGSENPNGATVRFLVDGAPPPDAAELPTYTRLVVLFDGADEETRGRAREHWKVVKAAGCEATYWQQTPEGRWQKRA